jgi:GNAT superfamily N-acetyltransferase
MPSSYFEPRLVCRPALRSDTSDVLKFTKSIWDGEDYVPYVWHDWMDDPEGMLATAQYGAHAVGIAKVTLLSPGQWWLEGLRVDPAYQGLKIGSHLHEYMDAWWIAHGDGILRLMTNSRRVQVQHLCDRTGFSRIGEVIGFRLDLQAPKKAEAPRTPATFRRVNLDDGSAAVKFADAHLEHAGGLMDWGWRFSRPDLAPLQELARRGRLHWWRDRRGLLATREDEHDGQGVLAIAFAACESADLAALLADAAGLAGAEGYPSLHWLAPTQPVVKAALGQTGFITDWDSSGYLYEKPHPRA